MAARGRRSVSGYDAQRPRPASNSDDAVTSSPLPSGIWHRHHSRPSSLGLPPSSPAHVSAPAGGLTRRMLARRKASTDRTHTRSALAWDTSSELVTEQDAGDAQMQDAGDGRRNGSPGAVDLKRDGTRARASWPSTDARVRRRSRARERDQAPHPLQHTLVYIPCGALRAPCQPPASIRQPPVRHTAPRHHTACASL
jgi:hypothetical protein